MEDSHINCRDWLILQEFFRKSFLKMLKSKAIEVVEDPEPEPEVDDKPGSEIVVELVSLLEEVSHSPRKL